MKYWQADSNFQVNQRSFVVKQELGLTKWEKQHGMLIYLIVWYILNT